LPSETHFCDDGWELHTSEWGGVEHHSCFLFGSDSEKVRLKISSFLQNKNKFSGVEHHSCFLFGSDSEKVRLKMRSFFV
jgi:hypothetical protein